MPAWARRSRPDRVRAPSKDAVKHRRSMPRISSAIAGWLLVKTRWGLLPGEGNLPIETMTLNAKTTKASALAVPPSMVLRAEGVIRRHHYEEEEERRREGRKGRRLSLSADPCHNQAAGRLAGRDARPGPNSHQRGRPRSGRGGEMEKAIERDARGSGMGARWHHLHRRDVQGRREADLRQGRLAQGPVTPLQLQPRRQH